MSILFTERLVLEPITVGMVEAVMAGRREDAERIAGARLPAAWPGRALVERAFTVSLAEIRTDPETRLWGDRLVLLKPELAGGERRVVGSVVFHGKPDGDGTAEVAYGIEEGSQGQGLATEATRASVVWALAQPGVRQVTATTLPWHKASLRVIEKCGMRRIATRDHDMLGELIIFGIAGETHEA